MAGNIESATQDPVELVHRYKLLREEEPKLFARDAAKRLGVGEGSLVAARCGDNVTHLDGRWQEMITAMPNIGRVMCLTRNDWVVHERKGTFENVRVSEKGGIVLGADIDLRLNFSEWHSGFAVNDLTAHGERKSLQIFNASGEAVHKIYLQEDSDVKAWEALIDTHTSNDQSPSLLNNNQEKVVKAEQPDEAIDIELMRSAWSEMTDVHQFMGLLKKFNVGRVQAFRLVGPEFAEKIDNNCFRRALENASKQEIEVMIFVPSPGVVQIHTGLLKNLKEVGDWYNVLDPDFNLHLMPEGIASTWLVRKPTKDGIVTSIETFDIDGNQIAWMFGKRSEGNAENTEWRGIAESLATSQHSMS